MKHYFIRVTTQKPKNKAHKALQEYANQYHHKVADENNLEEIIYLLRVTTSAVNETFNKCQSIMLHVHRYDDFDHVAVYVESNFNFIANEVKGFMIEEPIPVL